MKGAKEGRGGKEKAAPYYVHGKNVGDHNYREIRFGRQVGGMGCPIQSNPIQHNLPACPIHSTGRGC